MPEFKGISNCRQSISEKYTSSPNVTDLTEMS